MHLLIDPSDSNHLYGAGENGFFHSTNGGQTWEERNTGLEKSPGGEADLDVSDIAIHPTDPTHLFLSTFEGRIFHSIDQGAQWELLVKPDDMIGVIRLDPFPPYNLWAGSCGNIAYHNGTMFKIPLADPANYMDFPDLQISCGGSSSPSIRRRLGWYMSLQATPVSKLPTMAIPGRESPRFGPTVSSTSPLSLTPTIRFTGRSNLRVFG